MLPVVGECVVTFCKCGWPVYSRGEPFEVICPRCGQIILCHEGKARQPQGVGDTIENALDKVGGKQFKAAYKKVTGRDCGCNKRKQKLNEIFPYKDTS